MLTALLVRFPDYTIVERPSAALIARYRDELPPEVLDVWEQYWFGSFCAGYLKVVNPEQYAELLANTYRLTSSPVPPPALVLFATGMGDLIIGEDGYLSTIDYRHSRTEVLSEGADFFFGDLADSNMLVEELQWEPYLAARERLGEPAYDECFGYVPLLALGGPETVEQLQKVKLREHIALIAGFAGVLDRYDVKVKA
jgi:hypothetical protein